MPTNGEFINLDHNVNAIAAKNLGVRNAVRDEAREIVSVARGLLARHQATGKGSHVSIPDAKHVPNPAAPDWYVSLEVDRGGDPAALAIEFGRAGGVSASGRKVGEMQGLHILAQATGRLF